MAEQILTFSEIACRVRSCRICRDAPVYPPPLPHEPVPLLQGSASARLCIAGQAPGIRAHERQKTFADPSGDRLRQWLNINYDTFYDPTRIAIIPMGSCFPGFDAKGSDLPPRRECAEHWRSSIFTSLKKIELILTIGQYAQQWHLQTQQKMNVTETVKQWRFFLESPQKPRVLPLPHPSWRNNRWLKNNPWFEAELLPVLQMMVADILK